VQELAAALRKGGVDVELDVYTPHPAEGWAKWMEKAFRTSEFFIVVINKSWIAAFNQDAEKSSGARYEGALLSSLLASNGVNFSKIAIVCFEGHEDMEIPLIIRSCNRYHIDRAGEYEKLYALLTSQEVVERPPLGNVVPIRTMTAMAGVLPTRSFSDLCNILFPLFRENGRIFKDFGPNSGKERPGEPPRKVRFDLSIWERKRVEIVQNNNVIAANIKASLCLIPGHFSELFSRLLSHIDAFRLHVEDDRIDYRENQFPFEVLDVIRSAANKEDK
jgi:hypothetical protein